jgi:hypothetical protein
MSAATLHLVTQKEKPESERLVSTKDAAKKHWHQRKLPVSISS